MGKGFAIDMILFLVVILTFSFIAVISLEVVSNFKDATDPMFNSTARNIVTRGEESLQAPLDFGFAFIVFGLIMAMVASAFLLRSHPMFAVFAVILIAVIGFLGMMFANIFLDFASTAALVDSANKFPIMIWIWEHIPIVITFAGILVMVVLYFVKGGDNL